MVQLTKDFRGIVGVCKPVGPSSHQMVDQVRRITGERRVGHAGTLDPLAEGVLVIGVGREYTKQLDEYVGKEKEYVTEVKLGEISTTDDREGEIEPLSNFQIPISNQIDMVIKKFVGEIWQTPPLFSAVKVKGKEAYKHARKGKKVALEPRKREVRNIEVVNYQWPILQMKVVTGRGVYIRSLARDIGEELGVGGYMLSLIRTRVGSFSIEDCARVWDDTK